VEDSKRFKKVLPSFNATFLSLIPKEEKVETPHKLHPISLCNFIYKLISKIIVNRLKSLLPSLISPEQLGYVEGRQILDNIILMHDLIHSLHSSKKPGILIKLDLSKAFDNLNWTYILMYFVVFGFSETWIQWISSLLSSTFFSILINGSPSPTFSLSPFLFILMGDPLLSSSFLMVEGLGRTIKEEVKTGNWKGISLHGEESPASHQQFVYDNMLMASPTVKEALTIKQVLNEFSKASGMCVNKEKSNIYFFNTPEPIQRHLTGILGFQPSKIPSNYLGVPLTGKSQKRKIWEDLLDKMEKRLGNWAFHSLNIANRLILIKKVLQALPIYRLSAIASCWITERGGESVIEKFNPFSP
jgi:hypothetical protein